MIILSKFAERLNDLLAERNLTCSSFAKEMERNSGTISKYLLGYRLPSLPQLVKYADYFNVSTDYLLGLRDDSPYTTFQPYKPFKEQIEKLLKVTGKSKYAFVREAGIEESRFYAWCRGQNLPSVEHIVKMAEYLGVEIDYFIGRIN